MADGALSSESEPGLSPEQSTVLSTVLAGTNVFFTGSAGTGKSYILRLCVDALRRRHKKYTVYVTAPAGIAACNVGGTTLHSFAGIGKGDLSEWELIERVQKNQHARRRWKRCRVLVIDEISMLHAKLFDTLEAIARHVRDTTKPFGGIQLVVCGDFFQLPPVRKGSAATSQEHDTGVFCFDADTWSTCIQRSIILRTPFRQRDKSFIQMLNEFREGKVSDETERQLQQDAGTTVQALYDEKSDIQPTRLYALNKDVDRINKMRLQECQGEERVFVAEDTGQYPFKQQLQSSCTADGQLSLRVGAQVILLKNIDQARGLVNGTRGTVVSFECSESLSSPSSTSNSNTSATTTTEYPYVKFLTPKDMYIYDIVVPQAWTIEQGGESMATRKQIPLKLAYALSIHKSQGMTIDLMECSMNGIFEYGQSYVALSRATSLDRLLVHDFTRRAVRVHPRVSKYYERLLEDPPPTTTDTSTTMTNASTTTTTTTTLTTANLFAAYAYHQEEDSSNPKRQKVSHDT
jgi:ATP-dependent DNA helicase PIF1